jgi:hypothetical protein
MLPRRRIGPILATLLALALLLIVPDSAAGLGDTRRPSDVGAAVKVKAVV